MATYKIGYFVGSLAKASINRTLSHALIRLAPEKLEFTEIPIGDLPLYSQDYDADFPPEGQALQEGIAAAEGILFVSPEYNRSIPGALKNAIDWESRPWGTNSFARKPTGIIGASPGNIGTAVMQSSMRAVLSFLDAPQLNAPPSYCAVGAVQAEGAGTPLQVAPAQRPGNNRSTTTRPDNRTAMCVLFRQRPHAPAQAAGAFLVTRLFKESRALERQHS
ncbi:NADPH-dependent FMN reductase [Arthrobacter sp. NPDC093139]|uniref:NADPH-dependent FMN reductase n=1 Tax=Arthrobacter sp. NPDC093139 TaxID=3363945 RepID=UPI00380DD92C